MKRVTAILFLFLYLTSFSGVAVNTSYCCGRVTSVKVKFAVLMRSSFQPHQESCCNLTAHFYKVNDAQQAAAYNLLSDVPAITLPVLLPVKSLAAFSGYVEPLRTPFRYDSSPDLRRAVSLFTLYDSYLI